MIYTKELIDEINEELKTKTLVEISKQRNYNYTSLSRKLGESNTKNRESERSNLPINLFDEFGEICREIKAKASKERLSNIRLIMK